MPTHGRIELIDIIRGISILFVIMGHLPSVFGYGGPLSDLSLFRMPLFFFISGTVFSLNKPTNVFVLQKTDQLLKPYFVTLFALVALETVLTHQLPLQAIMGIIYGNRDTIEWKPLWYLTHLWLVFIFCFLFSKSIQLFHKSLFQKSLVISTLFLAGYFISYSLSPISVSLPIFQEGANPNTSSGLPFRMESLFISASFFLTGSITKERVKNYQPNIVYAAFSAIVFLMIAILTPAYVDIGKGEYRYPWYSLPASVAGIYLVVYVSYFINRTVFAKRWLILCGESSLFILIFHWFVQFKAYAILTKFVGEEFVVINSIISFLLGVFIPVMIRFVVRMSPLLSIFYLPVVGKPISIQLIRKPIKVDYS